MSQLDLPEWTKAKAVHAHKYEELHGTVIKDAVKMKWRIEATSNQLGEWFGKRVLEVMYMPPQNKSLDGVEPVWTERRSDLVEGPFKIKGEWPGYVISARRGIGMSQDLGQELGQSDVTGIVADPKQGGTVLLDVCTRHVGLSDEEIGKLCVMAGRDVELKAMPPKLQNGTIPESHKPAPKPSKGKSKPTSPKQMRIADAEKKAGAAGKDDDPPKDATDTFVDTHGNDETKGDGDK